ncbi:MAG TPA: hypothetical protein VIP57_00300, partial [Candidatus Dormibacteraeota bacterium]
IISAPGRLRTRFCGAGRKKRHALWVGGGGGGGQRIDLKARLVAVVVWVYGLGEGVGGESGGGVQAG